MKTLKLFTGFALGTLLGLANVQADTAVLATYTTSKGEVFKQVNAVGFGVAWQDPAGKIWSSYQGDFTNAAILPDWFGIIRHSEATEACKAIGGRLPSVNDYRNLMKHFDARVMKVNGATISIPTEAAVNDFESIFPDNINPNTHQDRTFWTTTVGAGKNAYHFLQGGGGPVLADEDGRDLAMSVRCIRDEFREN